MKCKKEKYESDYDSDSIWFTYKGECSAFLDLDVAEHPQLNLEDREKLGDKLLDTVEKYIEEKGTFKMEEHSSSIHILRGKDTVAKVWYDRLVDSAIKSKDDAYKVSKKLIEMLEDKNKINYPHIKPVIAYGDSCNLKIVEGDKTLAKFKNRTDAQAFLDILKTNGWESQKISKKSNITSLQYLDGRNRSIELFHGMGFFPSDLANKILYCLRKYINEEL